MLFELELKPFIAPPHAAGRRMMSIPVSVQMNFLLVLPAKGAALALKRLLS